VTSDAGLPCGRIQAWAGGQAAHRPTDVPTIRQTDRRLIGERLLQTVKCQRCKVRLALFPNLAKAPRLQETASPVVSWKSSFARMNATWFLIADVLSMIIPMTALWKVVAWPPDSTAEPTVESGATATSTATVSTDCAYRPPRGLAARTPAPLAPRGHFPPHQRRTLIAEDVGPPAA
jgi:hypothetical protein